MEKVFSLGVPGPSGNDNDTYVGEEYIYKVNNLLNCGGILNLLEKIIIHNEVFPETFSETLMVTSTSLMPNYENYNK